MSPRLRRALIARSRRLNAGVRSLLEMPSVELAIMFILGAPLLFLPAFLTGSLIIYWRLRSKLALLLSISAVLIGLGRLLKRLSPYTLDEQLRNAPYLPLDAIPPLYLGGGSLAAAGYVLFALSFVAYALAQKKQSR